MRSNLVGASLLALATLGSASESQSQSVLQLFLHKQQAPTLSWPKMDACFNSCKYKHGEICKYNKQDQVSTCVCKEGYAYGDGTNCKKLNCYKQCGNPKDGLICKDLGNGFRCEPATGWSWTSAEKKAVTKDNVCKNKCTMKYEVCVIADINAYRCQCWSGYHRVNGACKLHPACANKCTGDNMVCVVDVNKAGGSYCKCWEGYAWKDKAKSTCVEGSCDGKCGGNKQLCYIDHKLVGNHGCFCENSGKWGMGGKGCIRKKKWWKELMINGKPFRKYKIRGKWMMYKKIWLKGVPRWIPVNTWIQDTKISAWRYLYVGGWVRYYSNRPGQWTRYMKKHGKWVMYIPPDN